MGRPRILKLMSFWFATDLVGEDIVYMPFFLSCLLSDACSLQGARGQCVVGGGDLFVRWVRPEI